MQAFGVAAGLVLGVWVVPIVAVALVFGAVELRLVTTGATGMLVGRAVPTGNGHAASTV